MELIENVACTVCGCVCDDLRLTLDGGRVVRADGACHLAEPWYLSQDYVQPPPAEVEGRPASLEEALDRAAAILRASRSPLIYGLSRSSTEGQRAARSGRCARWSGVYRWTRALRPECRCLC